jgi:hypothetical protein
LNIARLNGSLGAWNTPEFNSVFKDEIRRLGATALPLQQGLSRSSHVSGDSLEAVVLGVSEDAQYIRVKAGIFFEGVIAGCSCADDPSPVDEQTEYCVLLFDIDRQTADTVVTLIEE